MATTQVEVRKHIPTRSADPWRSFHDQFDRMFERFAGGLRVPTLHNWFGPEPAWTFQTSFSFPKPAIDVTEDDKAYKITAELPGLEEKDIDVTVTGGLLTIRGEKSYEKGDDKKNKERHVSERAYGSFERAFVLPDSVDAEKIAADLAKGVLTVTLPKTAQAAKQQKIEVKAAQ